jgi:PBSX family phage terminase large subunit
MLQISEPSERQARSIVESDARINIWHGSVRSGKTIGSIVRWLDYADRGPEGDLLMVGKTERTLRRNIIDPIQALLGAGELKPSWGTGEATLWGRKIYLAGAADERAEQKIRGLTTAGVYGDELTLWPESFFKMALSRMSLPGAKFFGTTNPDTPRHWLKRDWLDRQAELDLKAFHFTLRDNPHLDEAFVASLSTEYTGLWKKRFIDGLWVVAEGSIWDMFDDKVHVVDEVPRCDRYWVGVDYGTVNPFVALLVGLHEATGRYYVCAEWRWESQRQGRQLSDAEYSAEIRKWIQAKSIAPACHYVDPSAASFIVQLARDGVYALGADNEVIDGIRGVANLLSARQLFIHRSCTGLIDEIQGYIWDAKAQARGKDEPLKVDDHGPDVLRYVVRMLTLYGPGAGGSSLEAPMTRGTLSPFESGQDDEDREEEVDRQRIRSLASKILQGKDPDTSQLSAAERDALDRMLEEASDEDAGGGLWKRRA